MADKPEQKSSTQQLLEEITKLRITNEKLVEREQDRESIAKFRCLIMAATCGLVLLLNIVFIALNKHNGMMLFWLGCAVWWLFFLLPAKWLPFKL